MNILGSVPFESLENLLYMKYSICLWERGMARRAEHLSSEKVNACVFLRGTPQNGWFPFGFAYTLERETDPNGKSWDPQPHGLLKAVHRNI